jgi:hypothetical protein
VPGAPAPPLFTAAAGATVKETRRDVAAGVEHRHLVLGRGRGGAGPWSIHILDVDLARAAPAVALGGDRVEGRHKTSEIAAARGAPAAVNAGYFVMVEEDGVPGDPAGILVIDGRLISEAIAGRAALILERDPPRARVARIATRLTLRGPGFGERDIDGINRAPGLVRNCGGRGDQPGDAPLHDITCTDPDELILFDDAFGPRTPTGPGREAVLEASGEIASVRERGGEIPAGGRVLVATGGHAGWLESAVVPGARVEVAIEVTDGAGAPLPASASVVNGGPQLVRAGTIEVTDELEGFDHPHDPEFHHHFAEGHHPRTFAAITAAGHLLLVVADGRQPGHSVGLTFAETAELALSLGAVDAVNLDGGGSSAMAIGGALVNRPSDSTGERAVGDVLLLAPR